MNKIETGIDTWNRPSWKKEGGEAAKKNVKGLTKEHTYMPHEHKTMVK